METTSLRRAKAWQTAAYLIAVLLLLGTAVTLIFTNLENQVIMAFDEGRHGVSGYEMIRNQDYLVHTYQGEPDMWNLKPPLSFWLIAFNFKLFGYHCVAFRLHNVIASLLVLLAVTLWTKKHYGMTASLLALLFLVVNPAVYGLNFARTGEADALHTLFVTLAMLCMLDSRRDLRLLYGSALGFGLSFMSKSYHAAIIPLICLVYLTVTGQLRRLRLKNYLLLLFWGLLPIFPWAVARFSRDGFAFLGGMFTTDVQARMAAEVSGAEAQWNFYLLHLKNNPVVIASVAACGASLLWQVLQRRKLTDVQKGLALWAACPVALYSLSNAKLYHYIVPVMVPLSLAGALAAWSLLRQLRPRSLKLIFCCLLVAGAAWQTSQNLTTVLTRDDKGSMQATLAEALDRETDSGRPVYIQYSSGQTEWMQNDMLRALLSGDVLCRNGGMEAFEEEWESALLVIDKENMDYTFLEMYPVYYETGYQFILEN